MKILLMMLIISSAQSAYCKEKSDENHAAHKHSVKHENQEQPKLSLNQGNKWQMDAHTRQMFQVMTNRLDSEVELNLLGTQLNEDLQKLIKGCTMTGDAHDQLHQFLTPFMPAVKSLSETGSPTALNEVKHALHNYQVYFE